ncbi:hypothetical protein BZA05DRAFT_135256 [Tricharina praecox]|uniref:uncharacterized protein n=1 Tax=Tricharina praecox TaxID=43433 RepID=UPI00221FBA9B|nr:uncharacterized protein BZA05DRAFT_135256 [Tricharina praecox]KAI5846750.1 hypothetical protein BZA05DRAFT_135256 [Tricharina praecox]
MAIGCKESFERDSGQRLGLGTSLHSTPNRRPSVCVRVFRVVVVLFCGLRVWLLVQRYSIPSHKQTRSHMLSCCLGVWTRPPRDVAMLHLPDFGAAKESANVLRLFWFREFSQWDCGSCVFVPRIAIADADAVGFFGQPESPPARPLFAPRTNLLRASNPPRSTLFLPSSPKPQLVYNYGSPRIIRPIALLPWGRCCFMCTVL